MRLIIKLLIVTGGAVLSCRKDPNIIVEPPVITEPFTVKHLEGNYTGVENYQYEKWHYSGPLTESHWSTWNYSSNDTVRPALAIIENTIDNVLNISAEDVDFWYPNFEEDFVLDSTLVYSESYFNVAFTGSMSDSLIIDVTVVHFDRDQDMISYTESSTYNLFTLQYKLRKD